MNKIVIIKIVIEVILFCSIFVIYSNAADNHPEKKRFYKAMMGIAYMVTALLSIWVAGYFGKSIYFYTIIGFIFSVGSLLSAINTNIRNMYASIFACMFWLLIAYYIRDNHKTISIILAILGIACIPFSIKEGIDNMKEGIDPDVVEEEKARKRKSNFKLVKSAFKLWRMGR